MNPHYKIQIDGLRFFAIFSVLVSHWISSNTNNVLLKSAPWGRGVILFFVISGFLITNILLNQKEKIDSKKTDLKQSLKTFYIRRFFRIFPLYYLVILFLFCINYPKAREIFPWLLTYTSNLLQAKTNTYLGDFSHFWSLAIEEQFYIIWPIAIFLTPKKHIFKLLLITIIVSFVSRAISATYYQEDWMVAAYFTPNLFLPLALGGTLSYLKKNYTVSFYNFFKPVYAFLALIIYGLLFYYFHLLKHSIIFNLLIDEYISAIAFSFFVATASIDGFTGLSQLLLENKWVNHLGKISYGLYVFHLFIPNFFWNTFVLITHITASYKTGAWILYFILCICFASISYRFFELPINNLKNKFKY